MTNFTRADRSVVGLWWWTVDRWTLATVGALIFMGAILVLAASTAVATRIGLDSLHMVRQQYVMLPVALTVVVGVSMLSPRQVRRLGVLLFLLMGAEPRPQDDGDAAPPLASGPFSMARENRYRKARVLGQLRGQPACLDLRPADGQGARRVPPAGVFLVEPR